MSVSGPISTVKSAVAVYHALGAVAEKKKKTPLLTMSIMGLYASFWISLGAMLAIWISAGNQSQVCTPLMYKTNPIPGKCTAALECPKVDSSTIKYDSNGLPTRWNYTRAGSPAVFQGPCTLYPASAGMRSFTFGALFPLGLILIFFIGAELFTGDTMYMVAGWLLGKSDGWDLLKVWVISWVTNFLGAAIMAFFFGYLTDYASADPALVQNNRVRYWLIDKTYYKIQGMGWGVVFLKAILCNTLVNCAVWSAGLCDDTAGKILAIWWPIMAFAACGYEHSVANMFMITLGLMLNTQDMPAGISFGWALWKNLIPATLGNIFGGAVVMGLAWWYCLIYAPPGSLGEKPAASPAPTPASSPSSIALSSPAPAAAPGIAPPYVPIVTK